MIFQWFYYPFTPVKKLTLIFVITTPDTMVKNKIWEYKWFFFNQLNWKNMEIIPIVKMGAKNIEWPWRWAARACWKIEIKTINVMYRGTNIHLE